MMYVTTVISLDSYSKFVNNKTGHLINTFDATQCHLYKSNHEKLSLV